MATGNRYYKNFALPDNTAFRGDMHGSNFTWFNGTDQYADLPLDVTLSADYGTTISTVVVNDDEVTTYTKNSDNSFDLAVTTVGTNIVRPYLNHVNTTYPADGTRVVVSFMAVVHSGTPILRNVYAGGVNTIDYVIRGGYNAIELRVSDNSPQTWFYFNGTNLFDISVTDLQTRSFISLQTQSILYNRPTDGWKAIADATVGENLGTTMARIENSGEEGYSTLIDNGDGYVDLEVHTVGTNNVRPYLATHMETYDTDKHYGFALEEVTVHSGTCEFTTISVAGYQYNVSLNTLATGVDVVETQPYQTPIGTLFKLNIDGRQLYNVSFRYVPREVVPHSSYYRMKESFQDFCTLDVVVTQSDVDYLNDNPDALRDMWFGRKTHPTLSFDETNFQTFYPAGECSEFVLLHDTAVRGDRLLQNIMVDRVNLPFNSTAPTYGIYDEVVTFNSTTDNDFDIEVTTVGTNAYRPQVVTNLLSADIDYGNYYNISFHAEVVSGECKLQNIGLGSGTNITLEKILKTGTYSFIGKYDGASGANAVSLRFRGTALFKVNVTNWKFDVVTGSEIAEYTTGCKTTFNNTNYGATDFLFTKDSSGRLTGRTDDGFADFANKPDAYIETHYKISTAKWSLVDVVYGNLEVISIDGVATGAYSIRAEMRMLDSDGTYKINNQLQNYSPTAPTADVFFNLQDSALFGGGSDDSVSRRIGLIQFTNGLSNDTRDNDIYNEFIALYDLTEVSGYVVYDAENIEDEFTTLVDTEIVDGTVEATEFNGYAIAEDVGGDGAVTLTGVTVPFEADFEFTNITYDTYTVANELHTFTPIEAGDRLVIVKDNNSINEITINGADLTEGISDGSLNASEVRAYDIADRYTQAVASSVAYSNPAANAFNGSTTYGWAGVKPSDTWVYWDFIDAVVINKAGVYSTNWYAIRIEASHDGVSWDILHSDPSPAEDTYVWFTWINSTKYRYYRIYCDNDHINEYVTINDIIWVEADLVAVLDTSATTSGETPSRVYAIDAKTSMAISGGYVDATLDTDNHSLVTIPKDSLVEQHTTNVGTNGEASSVPANVSAYLPYDGDTGTKYTFTSLPVEYRYNFTASKTVAYVRWYISDVNKAPKTFTIDTSSDGSAWTARLTKTIATQQSVGWSELYEITTPTDATWIRLKNTINWSGTDTEIGAIEWYDQHDVIRTNREYVALSDATGSTTISPKVTLKSIGDKLTKMKFTVLSE